jgi:hypothetical protein
LSPSTRMGLGPIPACTGQPWPTRTRSAVCWAYPRVHGVTE